MSMWRRQSVEDESSTFVRAVYAEHAPALLSYVNKLTGDRAKSEDIVQETVLRAWRHAERLGSDDRPLRPWLFTVAARLVVDDRRARSSRPQEVDAELLELLPANDRLDRMLDHWQVLDALNTLSSTHRATIIETYYHGHSVNEAATVLGVPPGTVKSRAYYALRALRLALEERGVDAVNNIDSYRLSLGAYVLGALDSGERVELESHLPSCPGCQDELVQLAGLPGLLRQLSLEEVAGEAPEDPVDTDGLAMRALADLNRRQRQTSGRNRFTLLAVAASMIGVLFVGSLAAGWVGGDGWFDSGPTVTATDAVTHVSASVHMHQEDAGTELKLKLDGVPEKQRCMLVAIGYDGTRETAATWLASYKGDAELEGYTSISQDAMQSMEIVTPDGRTLLQLPVS